MASTNEFAEFMSQVAIAADLCIKPWKHSVLNNDNLTSEFGFASEKIDIILTIQCRANDGQRLPVNDFEVDIYKSGLDVSITISWGIDLNKPILWQGSHSLWMDSKTGKRCSPPQDSSSYEGFARRVRSFLVSE